MQKKTLPKSVLNVMFFIIMGLVFCVMWGKELPFDAMLKKGAEEKAVQKKVSEYSLEPIVVELAGRYLKVDKAEEGTRPHVGTRNKYLKIAIGFELKNETAAKELENRLIQVRDAVTELASSKKFQDIETVEGKAALGDEIVVKLNSILQEDSINKAFFAEFIVH